MSRPVKRGFPPQDLNSLEYYTSNEAQCNINASYAKRQRQHSINAVSNDISVQQDTFLWNTSGSSDPQPGFTEIRERDYGITWHDNIDRNFGLEARIPDLPLSFITPSPSGIPNPQLLAMLDPNFGYAEASANQSAFQMRIDAGIDFFDFFTLDQVGPNGLWPQDLGNIDLLNSHPPLWSDGPDVAGNPLTLNSKQGYRTRDHLHCLTWISLV
jgi:hypothetical protein